jgi:hypothetical protein
LTRPNIFLCPPTYDGKGEARGYWHFFNCATRNLNERIIYAVGGRCSLLALGFNSFVCDALNDAERLDIGYFGMMHSDIIPEPGWLDILWRELHEYQADVVSAVIPIKDPRGLTSTAIDDPKDSFDVLRRLTTAEVHSLPETFNGADCGHPGRLLVNTGLWLARLEVLERWADEYAGCFTIRDRIIKRPADGKRFAQAAPEDWNFSRDLNRLGASVYATRAVRLKHVGQFEWDSDHVFGQKMDEIHGPKFGNRPLPTQKALTAAG